MRAIVYKYVDEGSVPSVGGDVKWADFVVEKSPHGEPVERLVTAPADAAVVHVRRHGYAQAFLAASVTHAIKCMIPADS